MIINWTPQNSNETIKVVRSGLKLTVNGELFDFSFMREGDELPGNAIDSPWFSDHEPVRLIGGELEVTMILPIPGNPNYAQRFPQGSVVTKDGPVTLPGADE